MLESPWYKVFDGIEDDYVIFIFGKDIMESIYRSHCNSFVCWQFWNRESISSPFFCGYIVTIWWLYHVTTIKHSTWDKQTTTNSFNSTCNLFLLISTIISFLYWKQVILLIRYHLPLVYTLVPSPVFTGNTILTFLNHLVVILPSFLHPIFIMAYVSLVLERLKGHLMELLWIYQYIPFFPII